MPSRLACWLRGHDWGDWSVEAWENMLGTLYSVRFCRQCGAMDRRRVYA